jgi:hypothetical protein
VKRSGTKERQERRSATKERQDIVHRNTHLETQLHRAHTKAQLNSTRPLHIMLRRIRIKRRDLDLAPQHLPNPHLDALPPPHPLPHLALKTRKTLLNQTKADHLLHLKLSRPPLQRSNNALPRHLIAERAVVLRMQTQNLRDLGNRQSAISDARVQERGEFVGGPERVHGHVDVGAADGAHDAEVGQRAGVPHVEEAGDKVRAVQEAGFAVGPGAFEGCEARGNGPAVLGDCVGGVEVVDEGACVWDEVAAPEGCVVCGGFGEEAQVEEEVLFGVLGVAVGEGADAAGGLRGHLEEGDG